MGGALDRGDDASPPWNAWTREGRDLMESRPKRDLLLRMMAVLGNYDYILPRREDWPVMPTAKKSFELLPYGFFDRNPALDLPARP